MIVIVRLDIFGMILSVFTVKEEEYLIRKRRFVDVLMAQDGMDTDVLLCSARMDKFGIPSHTLVFVQVIALRMDKYA